MLIEALIASYIGIQKMPPQKIESLTITAEEAEPPSIRDFAKSEIEKEFGQGHWESFDKLITSESGWNPTAQNPHSTAFGLGQFLASTQQSYGISKSSSPEEQVVAVISYIRDRYDNPSGAWNFWQAHRWY